MHMHSSNGFDKSPPNPALDAERMKLVSQLNGRVVALSSSPAPAPAAKTSRVSTASLDVELAAAAHVSVNQVRGIRRLLRLGHERLVIATVLGLVPVSVALRSVSPPPRPSARQQHWQQIIALCS